jgi:hypothetical protein
MEIFKNLRKKFCEYQPWLSLNYSEHLFLDKGIKNVE